ncbi:hypothetical protein BSKO_08980 [Bryopsis sp. KO-2023]|nr:hypothetical protein BSKO_08980 [Bryopsis sp. KO-2023]
MTALRMGSLFVVVMLLANFSTLVCSEKGGLKFLNNGIGLTELLPGDQETVRLGGGESLTVCGGMDWAVAPHCMQYEYKSTYLLETFAMEKDIYQAVSAEGGKIDDKEMLKGSQCLAEECTKTVELDTGSWCLIMTNMDQENRETNVTFGYKACMSRSDKDDFIFILLGVIGGLMFIICICMCVCCCMCSRKKNAKKAAENTSMTATVQYHPNDMGWYVPPNPQDVYGPHEPLYIQQPYPNQPPPPPPYQPL